MAVKFSENGGIKQLVKAESSSPPASEALPAEVEARLIAPLPEWAEHLFIALPPATLRSPAVMEN